MLLLHHHADVDCIASAIALESVLENATICASDGISSHGQKIASKVNSKILERPPETWDGTVIALDCPNPEHCGPVPKAKQIVVIDHHSRIEGWPKGTEIIHQPQMSHQCPYTNICCNNVSMLRICLSGSYSNQVY